MASTCLEKAENIQYIDYDNQGDIVSIEILDAEKRITQPTRVVYQIEEWDTASRH